MKRAGRRVFLGVEWVIRIVWGIAVGIYAIVALGLIGVLVVSLIVHFFNGTLGHEEDGEGRVHRRSSQRGGIGGYPLEEGSISGRPINPTPEKENGEDSYEFEPEDIERAENAPQAVQEYCAGAVSEAQEVGCLSHVEASEVP